MSTDQVARPNTMTVTPQFPPVAKDPALAKQADLETVAAIALALAKFVPKLFDRRARAEADLLSVDANGELLRAMAETELKCFAKDWNECRFELAVLTTYANHFFSVRTRSECPIIALERWRDTTIGDGIRPFDDWQALSMELLTVKQLLLNTDKGEPVGAKEGSPVGDDPPGGKLPPLSDKQYLILEKMKGLNATSADTRRTAEAIAIKCDGKTVDVNVFKPLLSHLKKLGLVESKTGRGGGSWLSPEGIELADTLLRNRQVTKPKR